MRYCEVTLLKFVKEDQSAPRVTIPEILIGIFGFLKITY